MSLVSYISVSLLQATAVRDTIVTVPVRSWLDYTNGTLQLIVLVLSIVVLGALAYMLLALKKGLDALKGTVDKLYVDAKPIVQQASQVTADAREVVAMIRTDVERVTFAAGEVSEQLLDIAASTERRMDDINAVIDVVQGELEDTVLSTAASLRGARVGGRAIASALSPRRKKARPGIARPRAARSSDAPSGVAVSPEDDRDADVAEDRERELKRLKHATGEHEREISDREAARRMKREARRAGERG